MAFTGTPVVTQVADNLFCITGLSLGIGSSGTIGLEEKSSAAEVSLPDGGTWDKYINKHGVAVDLTESVQVEIEYADAAATTVEPISVVKAGATPQLFAATLTNRDAAVSGALVIYVRFH